MQEGGVHARADLSQGVAFVKSLISKISASSPSASVSISRALALALS